MNIIIPMAGMGKRMRPHTLTTPKPLLEIAGKSIVERLIVDLANMVGGQVDEVSYIIGNFGKEVEDKLHEISARLGYKSKIYYQLEALGTAHALSMANESLVGNVLVAYADTLFNTDFKIDPKEDAYIWVMKIDNPSQFGVVEHNQDGYITRFVEKPKEFVSDLAIIGIYYFKDGLKLKSEIDYLLENQITGNGEYQLTDALENLRTKGMKIKTTAVTGWFDCGNKNATVNTNAEILKLLPKIELIDKSVKITNSKIIEPCFLGKDVNIIDSEIGPFVSIGKGTIIETSKITNSIIYNGSHIKNAMIDNSMIGSFVKYFNNSDNEVSLGDYSELI